MVCLFLPAQAARWTALAATLVDLALGIVLWANFDIGGAQWQFVEYVPVFGRFGWSLVRSKATLYAVAALFGVLSGLCLLGLTTSADANLALRYTLMSIAAVILGGGEFVGGRVSVIGAVLGAVTLTLAASFLAFLNVSSDWQIAVQGGILIVVLSLRVLLQQRGGEQ